MSANEMRSSRKILRKTGLPPRPLKIKSFKFRHIKTGTHLALYPVKFFHSYTSKEHYYANPMLYQHR
ncbi:hypothetical protein, partial [Siccibacter turicensis]|uniref:hypothetical protein n=1 Tax=Siccibacter turicensis TaxID=357233 RepID=UPI001F2F1592